MFYELVSVCIPTYNSGKFLEETLQSVLSQSYQNIEIIIGDNGSCDNTVEIIKKYSLIDKRISYYSNLENIGYAKNCNKLISLCNGEFISIFHSDDVYDVTIIEKEVQVLVSNPNLLGVFTSYYKINENGLLFKNVTYPINIKNNLISVSLDDFLKIVLSKGASCFCCPSSMIRKDVYQKLNGYDENLRYIEDQDMWARILLLGNLGILNEKLLKYRIHGNQGSVIYHDREIDEFSIPHLHILKFLEVNLLANKFSQEIMKAKAAEFIFFARLAAMKNDFNLFRLKLRESVAFHSFNFLTKSGFIQKFPFPKIIFLLTKFLYN